MKPNHVFGAAATIVRGAQGVKGVVAKGGAEVGGAIARGGGVIARGGVDVLTAGPNLAGGFLTAHAEVGTVHRRTSCRTCVHFLLLRQQVVETRSPSEAGRGSLRDTTRQLCSPLTLQSSIESPRIRRLLLITSFLHNGNQYTKFALEVTHNVATTFFPCLMD